ncbi:hypothetical protein [Aminobacter ciceronei]|uniref:Uncharacterized protein n=1 Tax=Aminobacter ciceronei TaxID=150723 RepID=A0ABR6C1N4_9HYPH|nr:hypothetical protein [Aminobacter ciceronei]MBA8904863.1 hypothetical protein [Aminobacter ciceronei]MBA9018583.1 hypothetical protein [Aminobacter ciceronei]
MCMFDTPKAPDKPQLPPEYAAMRQPDRSQVAGDVSSRVRDRARAATGTLLTSGSGVTSAAPTQKKTLLGA